MIGPRLLAHLLESAHGGDRGTFGLGASGRVRGVVQAIKDVRDAADAREDVNLRARQRMDRAGEVGLEREPRAVEALMMMEDDGRGGRVDLVLDHLVAEAHVVAPVGVVLIVLAVPARERVVG